MLVSLLSLIVWLFIELRFLFNYNLRINEDFFRASFHSMISITISSVSIVINVILAVFVAHYLNQQRINSRKSREHSEKIVSDLQKLIWELSIIEKDGNDTHNEMLILSTRCEHKINQIRDLEKYINKNHYVNICNSWEKLGEFLGQKIIIAENEGLRQNDISKNIIDIDKVCDKIITDLWIKNKIF